MATFFFKTLVITISCIIIWRQFVNKLIKILVTSQKGGVGKSTISANLAAYFSSVVSKKTCLVDFDHQATSGQWVKKATPLGIKCRTVDLPNSRGSGITLLTAKEFIRKTEAGSDVLVSDLTWTDVLPPEFLFGFNLILVPSSLSRVELNSTLEFVNRFSYIFNSKMRKPPKLVIVPSRVDNLNTYHKIFSNSFSSGFFLSPPVLYSPDAHEYFCKEFFIFSKNNKIKENFNAFGKSILDLAVYEQNTVPKNKHETLTKKVSGSILDRFRAIRNSTPNQEVRKAANEEIVEKKEKSKSSIPFFLRR